MRDAIPTFFDLLEGYELTHWTDAIEAAFRNLDAIADEVLSFGMPEIHVARTIIDAVEGVSARDALHVAIMRSSHVSRILSFDRGFDAFPELERFH